MLLNREHIGRLWQLYLTDQATLQQMEELLELLNDPRNEEQLYLIYQETIDLLDLPVVPSSARQDIELAWSRLQQAVDNTGQQPPVHRVHFLKTSWFRYAAAVVLVLGATAAILKISNRRSNETTNIAKTTNDITPGDNRAMLTLADGTTIMLDSAGNGALAQQGNASIVKLGNGQLAYNLKGTAKGNLIMNTMTTPRGGQYKLRLPDGTNVWLNAESSISFPVAFTGNDRTVKVTGEAYFEVVKDKKKPFIVTINDLSRVEVLGTSFNVNSYGDEGDIKTTLLEGKVRVVNAGNNPGVSIDPGQQAIVYAAGDISVRSQVNLDEVMAWKNGQFLFDSRPLEMVMKDIARWYNVEIAYEGKIPALNIRGTISRKENINQVLNLLELTETVHFRIEGRKVIVIAGKRPVK